jgi:hypothetical protein
LNVLGRIYGAIKEFKLKLKVRLELQLKVESEVNGLLGIEKRTDKIRKEEGRQHCL